MESLPQLPFFVGLMLLLGSCNGGGPAETENEDTAATVITPETLADPSGPFPDVERTPKHVYEADSIRIESYDFEQFEPFLHSTDPAHIYVVNFWATWCVPCVAELPYFEQLGENYKDKGVHVLLVSIDFAKAVNEKLIPFVRDKKLKSEVVLLDDPDANSWIEKVDENWSGAIPATVIYHGTAGRSFHEGSMTYEELEAEVGKYLSAN